MPIIGPRLNWIVPLTLLSCILLGAFGAPALADLAIWANNGEDKVVQGDLRATSGGSGVTVVQLKE